jgi:hypothetical protein
MLLTDYCLRFDIEVVCIVSAGYIFAHYCLMFYKGVVHIVVAVVLLTISVCYLIEEWFILLLLVILSTINY